MTINIVIIYENVFLLYETMYNDNIYFYYTSSVFLLYEMMYNIYFIIRESIFLLYETMYNDNIYFSLYKKIYNEK